MESIQHPISEVGPDRAYECVKQGEGVIVDVREVDELQQISIPNALHIPLGQLQSRQSEIPRDRDVFFLCHVGQRSAMATEYFQQLGFERVHNIQGGVIAWIKARLPAEWGSGS